MSEQDLKQTIIRLVDLSFDNKPELERVLNEKNVTEDSIKLRRRAANLISDIEDRESAFGELVLYL